jgi:Rha family phage regulatory protein
MNDLVVVKGGVLTVNSLKVAEKFGKAHRTILLAIRNLDCSDDFRLHNFMQSSYTNKQNKTVPCYELTRDGFSFLCMGFTGKEAAKWKEGFIKAFNSMERELLKQQDKLEWKQARLQSKDVRKSITSTIRDFVDYATGQGSKSASMYYANITKMEYAALEMVDKGGKIPTGFRDTLDSMDLCFLMTAEQIAKQTLMHGMNEGLHYKEIYQLAKQRVMNYAESVKMPRLEV